MLLRMFQGPYSRYGLPENVRPPLSHHPTLNSDLLDFIRHGRINPRPAIKQLLGDKVEFVNGEREPFDIICVCTGFWTTFPFFDKSFIDFQHVEKVPLYRKMMHAEYSNLYFIGLFQPVGCIWPLADYQAKLAYLEEFLADIGALTISKAPFNMKSSIRISISRAEQRHSMRWIITAFARSYGGS